MEVTRWSPGRDGLLATIANTCHNWLIESKIKMENRYTFVAIKSFYAICIDTYLNAERLGKGERERRGTGGRGRGRVWKVSFFVHNFLRLDYGCLLEAQKVDGKKRFCCLLFICFDYQKWECFLKSLMVQMFKVDEEKKCFSTTKNSCCTWWGETTGML